jgi:hypothetical protein
MWHDNQTELKKNSAQGVVCMLGVRTHYIIQAGSMLASTPNHTRLT